MTIVDDEPPHPWLNPANSYDVNGDGFVAAIDVLLIINMINTTSGSALPPTRQGPFVDASGDDFVTALDALLVINYLNTHPSGEGEPASGPSPEMRQDAFPPDKKESGLLSESRVADAGVVIPLGPK